MNDSELIDDLKPVDPVDPGKPYHPVRLFSSLLCGVLLILTAFCYMDIVRFLNHYAELRGKILLGAESLHGMVSVFCIGSIPVIAYNCRSKKAAAYTLNTYILPLILAAIFFVVFLLLGMELLFAISPGLGNSLMPGVMVVPPFSAYLDLVFIGAALLSFGTLKMIFRKRRVNRRGNK